MSQQLEAKVVITIPDDMVLVDKVEYQKLLDDQDVGKLEDMKWLKKQIGIANTNTIRKEILDPNRKELEKFVKFADGSGNHWKFHKRKMKKWIDDNFDKVAGR